MSQQAICQRCGEREFSWTVREASFNVREMIYWKVQLCERCAVYVEMILRSALQAVCSECVTVDSEAPHGR
jgi:hypothetical protein